MKFMYSKCCNSFVVPTNFANIQTKCKCGKTACWWKDIIKGLFVVWDETKKNAWVIGIHNAVFTTPVFDKIAVQEFIKKSDGYIFKDFNSLIVRIYPGFTNDTRFAEPGEFILKTKVFVKLSYNKKSYSEEVDYREYWDEIATNISYEQYVRPISRFEVNNNSLKKFETGENIHCLYGWLESLGQSDDCPNWVHDGENLYLEVYHEN